MDSHISSRLGISAELAVALNAISCGFTVCQPIGCYAHYDLIIDVNGVLIKVQVKNVRKSGPGAGSGLKCHNTRGCRRLTKTRRPYNVTDFDFAACYDRISTNVFIIPFEVFTYNNGFYLPQEKQHLYKNAWHLLEEFAALKSNWCLEEDFNPTDVKFNS